MLVLDDGGCLQMKPAKIGERQNPSNRSFPRLLNSKSQKCAYPTTPFLKAPKFENVKNLKVNRPNRVKTKRAMTENTALSLTSSELISKTR